MIAALGEVHRVFRRRNSYTERLRGAVVWMAAGRGERARATMWSEGEPMLGAEERRASRSWHRNMIRRCIGHLCMCSVRGIALKRVLYRRHVTRFQTWHEAQV